MVWACCIFQQIILPVIFSPKEFKLKLSHTALYLSAFLLIFLSSCSTDKTQETTPSAKAKLTSLPSNNSFNEYWYKGEAEITSYDLSQARYGENHEGEAVMVFVTEPFSKSKQVKLDNGQSAGKDKVNILKLNLTKKFYTGVYPYSMMMSAFTPIDRKNDGQTLKISSSSQEWCGHSFTQYNLDKKSYDIHQYSYFESEGDIKTSLPATVLEDEIWSLIRINPDLLPTGNFNIIPGTFFGRLRHTQFAQVSAKGTLIETDNDFMLYTINFERPERTLTIQFKSEFPFTIESWEESYKSGFGSSAKTLTTTATKKKSIKLDYWSKNGLEDAKYREELGLR